MNNVVFDPQVAFIIEEICTSDPSTEFIINTFEYNRMNCPFDGQYSMKYLEYKNQSQTFLQVLIDHGAML